MSEWQPIETAPKDGTYVLLWAGGKSPYISRYVVSERYEHGVLERKWEYWSHPLSYFGKVEPTHWMPLPEYPEPALTPGEVANV